MSEELKLCPFCGGKVEINMWNGDKCVYDWDIVCPKCNATVSFGVGYKGVGKKETIKAWNRRAE